MAPPKIKECPNPSCIDFEVKGANFDGVHYVRCNRCGMTGPVSKTKIGSVSMWNMLPRLPIRVKHRVIAKEMADLRKAGYTYKYIADLYEVSISKVYYHVNKLEEKNDGQ